MDKLTKSKSIYNLKEMKEILDIMNQLSQNMELSKIQTFIISFYSYYNNLTSNNTFNEKIIQLSLFMVDNFKNDNLLKLIQNEISQIFPEYEILSHFKEIDDYIMCFSLCDLSKNIELMKIFFTRYLNTALVDSIDYHSINLQNPFSTKLFKSLFTFIYQAIKDNKKGDLDSIIKECLRNNSNFDIYNFSRC